jgi:3-hydroxyisobutyrate dehydrogenase-like beta-hydroxyacid dehydrogenase
MTREEIGIVGLGRMGANLARHAAEHGHRVLGFSKDPPPDELPGVTILGDPGGFRRESR